MIEKRRPSPCIVTLPPSKICTTGTRLDPLWVSVIEYNTTAGVLRKGAVGNDMPWVVAKGTASVWTVVGKVTEEVAKRTVISHATVQRVAGGTLGAIRAFIFWAVDMKMPCVVAVKT